MEDFMSAYITFDNIAKHYHRADVITRALDGASFCVEQGELAVILGPSGAGKTTALNILGGMDTATSGQLLVDGRDITACNRRQLVEYRRYDIGFVFQFYNLVPNLTALENIELANQMKKDSMDAGEILKLVGLSHLSSNFPGQLSGGEQQRVAIARSLLLQPGLIVADEPIASLDISIQAQIVTLLQRLQKENRFSLLFIAHDLSVVRLISHRVGVMLQGKLVELADTEELFRHPMHPYTKALLSAIPIPDPVLERQKTIQEYDTSQPLGETMTERASGHFVLE